MTTLRLLLLPFILIFISSPLLAETNPISLKKINISRYSNYDLLMTQGFQPRKDVAPWPFKLPLQWDTDPFKDRNWQFQLHAWRIIDPAIVAYDKTGEARYLVTAIEIIEDWYNYHLVEKKQSPMQWYDMATGIRAMKLAWLKNELALNQQAMSESITKKVDHLLELHVEKLMDRSLLSGGNHAYFQLVGLRLACSTIPSFELCAQEKNYNDKMMANLLNNQFTKQGIHRENSPAYHFFAISTLKSLNIPALYNNEINLLINKAESISPWLTYPDKSIARIGDSEGKKATRGLEKAPLQIISGQEFLVGNYIDSGYFTIRTPLSTPVNKASQLFITGTSNPKEGGHKHADELSFELFYKGQLVFIDSGKYSYSKNKFRKYIKSANAHNTVSVEWRSVKPYRVLDSGSTLTHYQMNDKTIELKGHVERPEIFKHSRTFSIQPFKTIKIKDTFVDDAPLLKKIERLNPNATFVSNLHLAPDLTVTQPSKSTALIDGIAKIELQSEHCQLRTVRGQKEPLLGWASFSYNQIEPTSVIQARCADISQGELIWNITLL